MTTVIVVSPKAAQVINAVKAAIAKSPTGVSFFSIKSYTNKEGEVADHVFNVGASYANAKAKDIETLENLDVTAHDWKSPMELIIKARTALIESLKKPNETISEAQKDAYTVIVPGVKVHNESGLLYIYGMRTNKNVLVPGNYKTVNSRPDTIAKNELKKLLKTDKFRQFICSEGKEIKGGGETIEICH